MKPTYFWTAFLLLIISCAPLQNVKYQSGNNPLLGSLGKDVKTLLGKNFIEFGKPIINRALAVSVKEVSFTKSTFKTYQNQFNKNGEEQPLKFVDSLPKPTYLTLVISDKIGLISTLNSTENSDVRAFVSQDTDNSIVTTISAVLQPRIKERLLEADALYLKAAENGNFVIEMADGADNLIAVFDSEEIFEYSLSGFCWGKDTYGQKFIEALAIGGERCPRGTEQKAYKLDETKSYLKLK